MQIYLHATPADLGAAAAAQFAARLRCLAFDRDKIPVVFATGASQLETLRALTALPDLPWNRVIAFHMDEYLGVIAQHRASFRRYLRHELSAKVPLREFHEIQGDASDPETFAESYAKLLTEYPPQLCLAGIGENGHLAFNDPPTADFSDAREVKIVELDVACRQQQVNEGWFSSMEDVSARAITLTIPALMRIPEIILSVPGERKAEIVRRTLQEEISTRCPATILRTHPNAHLYLDRASAARC